MAFDIQAAKKSGYTDEDIADFLAKKHNFDLEGAKKAGYTADQIVGTLASKDAGTPSESKPTQPDWMNEPGLQDVSLTPLTDKDVQQAGVDATEHLASHGHEKIAPYVGTAIQMAPDIAMTAATMGGGAEATAGTKLGRIISGPGREAAGEAIGLAEKAGGISQTLPELKTLGKNVGLPNATPRQYIQRLLEMVQNGDITKVPVQKLAEHEEQIGRLLDKEPQGFLGNLMNSDKSQLGKKGVALASKTRAAISDAINELVPGRAEALADYGAAKTRNALYKGAAGAAGTAIVGGKARRVLKTLFSGGS